MSVQEQPDVVSLCGRYPADAQLTEMVDDLMRASPEFRAWWPDHEGRSEQV